MKAFIFGITGQAGSYLAEEMLAHGYEVHGLVRRTSFPNTSRLENILNKITLHEGDVTDYTSVANIFSKVQPDEIYQLCAQSHVGVSFNQPAATFHINSSGHTNVLEAFKNVCPKAKLLFSATSELYGQSYSVNQNGEKYQDINTPFLPNSPYAIAKLAAFHMTRLYRDSYNLYCCSTIANNHESPRRGENFVTRKITKYIGKLVNSCGKFSDGYFLGSFHQDSLNNFPKLQLGNIEAARDWSHAKDIVRAYRMILNRETPKDYVIGSGISHTVRDFLVEAFSIIGLDWQNHVEISQSCFRPGEVPYLRSDSSEIRKDLKWDNQVDFKSLVLEMVNYDIGNAYE